MSQVLVLLRIVKLAQAVAKPLSLEATTLMLQRTIPVAVRIRQTIQHRIQQLMNMSSAPSMSVYGQDSCVIPLAGGVTVIGFSGSFGSYFIDPECERRKSTSVLAKLGMKVGAISLMCQDENVWKAMMNAGTPCPIDGLIGEKAKARWVELGGYSQTRKTNFVKKNQNKKTDDKVEQYRKYKESMNEDNGNHNNN